MTRTVGVQRSASTAPVPKGTPPRCLAHTPHAPALVPPVVDHLLCRGGVSLRSRSASAAQQGRPIPSSPEKSKKTARKEKLYRGGHRLDLETSRSEPHGTPAVQAGKKHAQCAATSPKNWFTSLDTSTISVPKVLTQVNRGIVFEHALGPKSGGTQELRKIGYVIIVNRRRYGRRTSPCSYVNACCCLQLWLWRGSKKVHTQKKTRKKTRREGGKTPAGERESCRHTSRCPHTFLSHLWWGCHSLVHGLNPTFSRKSSVSQQLLVASGELDHQLIYIRPGSPAGIPESQFMGWRPFWPAARNPRQSTKGGRLG